ncbi:hypothetical protein [Urbifossiella limnaea]|uniref:DUF4339 domain-containing protein n=1 Tax=Urbifossiella limnaea TaxID=2528023 RepID=A0A517XW49_9BACT|nr:hypothetical protein [Urbifossiella limnaea]QDU21733.1 hypothetical protein ETAA1_37060 [Urbifossiella limnaea]
MPDVPPAPDQFWLLTGEVPTGPFTVAQIHAELAVGRASWQTPACLVGGTTWLPLVQTPGVGPERPPSAPCVSTPPPAPAAGGVRREVVPALATVVLIVVTATLVYGLYEWVRPFTPTEVCKRLERAKTAADAKKYATPRMHPLLDSMFADQSVLDPNDTFEWTQEADGPRPRTRRVGFRGSWLSPEAGHRVRMEGYMLVIQDGGWKADDMFITVVEGQALPAPGSLVEEHHRNPPRSAAGAVQLPPREGVGFWAFLERNWKGTAMVAFFVLAGAWNAFRPRPAARRAGSGGAG